MDICNGLGNADMLGVVQGLVRSELKDEIQNVDLKSVPLAFMPSLRDGTLTGKKTNCALSLNIRAQLLNFVNIA